MNFKTAYSTNPAITEAISRIKEELNAENISMVIYFASTIYDPHELSQAMQSAFAGVTTFGCTTAGEIVTGRMMENSIVAMAISKTAVQNFKLELLTGVSQNNNVESIFSSFAEHFGEPANKMNHKEYVGIVLIDGISGSEEKLMEHIGDQTNVRFVGGSAGDDCKFEKTYIFANGKAYTDAAVSVLMKPDVPFEFVKTQSFTASDKKLTVTKAGVSARKVLEFNHKPAVEAYSEALDISKDELEDYFPNHPLGIIDFSNEPYVRSPQKTDGDSIVFYCNIPEGLELNLLNATDIIDGTLQAINKKTEEMKDVSAIIDFHCILRFLELKNEKRTAEYSDLYKNVPAIGFATYGECFIGHINQTSTMLIFK